MQHQFINGLIYNFEILIMICLRKKRSQKVIYLMLLLLHWGTYQFANTSSIASFITPKWVLYKSERDFVWLNVDQCEKYFDVTRALPFLVSINTNTMWSPCSFDPHAIWRWGTWADTWIMNGYDLRVVMLSKWNFALLIDCPRCNAIVCPLIFSNNNNI